MLVLMLILKIKKDNVLLILHKTQNGKDMPNQFLGMLLLYSNNRTL